MIILKSVLLALMFAPKDGKEGCNIIFCETEREIESECSGYITNPNKTPNNNCKIIFKRLSDVSLLEFKVVSGSTKYIHDYFSLTDRDDQVYYTTSHYNTTTSQYQMLHRKNMLILTYKSANQRQFNISYAIWRVSWLLPENTETLDVQYRPSGVIISHPDFNFGDGGLYKSHLTYKMNITNNFMTAKMLHMTFYYLDFGLTIPKDYMIITDSQGSYNLSDPENVSSVSSSSDVSTPIKGNAHVLLSLVTHNGTGAGFLVKYEAIAAGAAMSDTTTGSTRPQECNFSDRTGLLICTGSLFGGLTAALLVAIVLVMLYRNGRLRLRCNKRSPAKANSANKEHNRENSSVNLSNPTARKHERYDASSSNSFSGDYSNTESLQENSLKSYQLEGDQIKLNNSAGGYSTIDICNKKPELLRINHIEADT